MSEFAGRHDFHIFQAIHGWHGIQRLEQPYREDTLTQFDHISGYAEHWKPGAVFVWLHCRRCDQRILSTEWRADQTMAGRGDGI